MMTPQANPDAPFSGRLLDFARRIWKRSRSVLVVLVTGAIFLAIAAYVSKNWNLIQAYQWRLDAGWVATAVVFEVVFYALIAIAWIMFLGWMGTRLKWLLGLWTWSRSSLARYLPTPVWATGSRTYFTARLGAPVQAALWSYVAEFGAALAGSLCASLLALPLWLPALPWVGWVSGAAAALVVLPLGYYWVGRPLAGRLKINLETSGFQMLIWSLLYFVSFIFNGAAYMAMVRSMSVVLPPAGILIGASALAWAAGTLNVFSPSGLGTREAVLILSLNGFLDPPHLLALGIMMRLVSVASELIFFVVLFGLSRILVKEFAAEPGQSGTAVPHS